MQQTFQSKLSLRWKKFIEFLKPCVPKNSDDDFIISRSAISKENPASMQDDPTQSYQQCKNQDPAKRYGIFLETIAVIGLLVTIGLWARQNSLLRESNEKIDSSLALTRLQIENESISNARNYDLMRASLGLDSQAVKMSNDDWVSKNRPRIKLDTIINGYGVPKVADRQVRLEIFPINEGVGVGTNCRSILYFLPEDFRGDIYPENIRRVPIKVIPTISKNTRVTEIPVFVDGIDKMKIGVIIEAFYVKWRIECEWNNSVFYDSTERYWRGNWTDVQWPEKFAYLTDPSYGKKKAN